MLRSEALSPTVEKQRAAWLRVSITAGAVGEISALVDDCSGSAASRARTGLLFGVVDEQGVQVKAIRQLAPSCGENVFDAIDRSDWDGLMRAVHVDAELRYLQVIGWYRYHPQGEPCLQPSEIAFHERFFPHQTQLGVIIRTDKADTLSALVCARSQDGSFTDTQHTAATLRLSRSREAEASAIIESGPAFSERNYLNVYDSMEASEERHGKQRWLIGGGIVAVLLAGISIVGAMMRDGASRPQAELAPANSLSLLLNTEGPRLTVNWTGGLPTAKQAVLKVFDGDDLKTIDLTRAYKPADSYTIPRHSSNIQAILLVSDGYRTWQSQSSVIDPAGNGEPAPSAALNQAERDELNRLRAENQKLQADLSKVQTRPASRGRRARR